VKVLLDESVDVEFHHEVVGHDVYTVTYMRWNGLKNGALLAEAAAHGFDVLVTTDRNIPHQQNVGALPCAVVIIMARSNDLEQGNFFYSALPCALVVSARGRWSAARPTPDVFLAYVEHALVPGLAPGDVVILDNLQPHKSPPRARADREGAGARLLYLPPYSPDFNPIENMWSKVKRHLRSAAARTFEALQEAVWSALDRVTPDDCVGFFRHCGYHAIRKGALL
jgi:transposase